MSHRITFQALFNGAPQTGTSADASLDQFLVAVNAWCNQRTADILTMFENAKEKFNRTGAGPIKGLWAKPA